MNAVAISGIKRFIAGYQLSASAASSLAERKDGIGRGRVIHHGPSEPLLADPERLASLVVAQ